MQESYFEIQNFVGPSYFTQVAKSWRDGGGLKFKSSKNNNNNNKKKKKKNYP